MNGLRKVALLLVIIFLLIGLIGAGCECTDEVDKEDTDLIDDDDDDDDDDDTSPNVDELIEEGEYWLSVPDGDRARLYFLEALEIIPDHPEAMYGLVLSDTVHTTDVISILTDYIMSLDYGGPVKGEKPSSDDLLNGILQRVLDGLLVERADELIEYAELTGLAGGEFDHDGIPIYINYENVATLSTEFDQPELYAASAMAGVLSGLVYHLYSVNLDFDISHAFRLVEFFDFGNASTEEILAVIVEVGLAILTDPAFPDFLTITEQGAENFQEAGMRLGDGLSQWLLVFPAIKAETDDQTDDVMGYVDANGNYIYDEGEHFFIPHFGELDDEAMTLNKQILALVMGLRGSFYDYTDKDLDPDNPNPFQLELLKPIFTALGLPAWIIPNMELDIGSWYLDPAGSGLKDTLITILRIIDLFVPDYQW